MMVLSRAGLARQFVLFCLCLCACGRIEFPSGQVYPDAAVDPDLGILVPDAGVELPDMGSEVICTPVPEPPVKPATWPYDSTAEAYEQYFFDEVAGNDTSVKLGCTRARCHGGEAESSPPYIPARPDLSNAMVLTQAIDELWATIVVGGSKSETRLRSAHLAGGEAEDRYTYSSFEDEALYAFEQGTIECRWQATYAARPDGGGGCPDASVTDVGETADGGDAADGGVEAACECRLPVRDLSHCRSP